MAVPLMRGRSRVSFDPFLGAEIARHLPETRDGRVGDPKRYHLPTVDELDLEQLAAGIVPPYLKQCAQNVLDRVAASARSTSTGVLPPVAPSGAERGVASVDTTVLPSLDGEGPRADRPPVGCTEATSS